MFGGLRNDRNMSVAHHQSLAANLPVCERDEILCIQTCSKELIVELVVFLENEEFCRAKSVEFCDPDFIQIGRIFP